MQPLMFDIDGTFFGDGDRDKRACTRLGYNFVLVGSSFQHNPQIENLGDAEAVLELLGL